MIKMAVSEFKSFIKDYLDKGEGVLILTMDSGNSIHLICNCDAGFDGNGNLKCSDEQDKVVLIDLHTIESVVWVPYDSYPNPFL